MANNPEKQTMNWSSEFPEAAELPSRIQNKLENGAATPATSPPPSVDRSADTVRPPTSSPKIVVDPKLPPSTESDASSVPAAPRVPVV